MITAARNVSASVAKHPGPRRGAGAAAGFDSDMRGKVSQREDNMPPEATAANYESGKKLALTISRHPCETARA